MCNKNSFSLNVKRKGGNIITYFGKLEYNIIIKLIVISFILVIKKVFYLEPEEKTILKALFKNTTVKHASGNFLQLKNIV